MSSSYSAAAVFLFLLVVVALPLPPTTAAKSRPDFTAFGRSSWVRNLTLLGSASILPGQVAVALTNNASKGTGAGRALFSEPVRLLRPADTRAAPAKASFSTRFTFKIVPSPSYGDGLAFILTSSSTFLGASNGFLGLYPRNSGDGELADVYTVADELADVSTVAVEFDTHRDVALRDPDGNHVALDANNIFSVASANPGLDLKAGVPITAWVEYRAQRRRLRVWISYSGSRRHLKPALSVVIDLSGLVDDVMFVGFSASNGEGSALHLVESWTFRTYWPRNSSHGPPPPAPSPPRAPSPPPMDHHKTPALVPANHHHRQLKVVAGTVSVSVLILFVGVVLGCVLCVCRRRRGPKSIELAMMSQRRSILPKEFTRSC